MRQQAAEHNWLLAQRELLFPFTQEEEFSLSPGGRAQARRFLDEAKLFGCGHQPPMRVSQLAPATMGLWHRMIPSSSATWESTRILTRAGCFGARRMSEFASGRTTACLGGTTKPPSSGTTRPPSSGSVSSKFRSWPPPRRHPFPTAAGFGSTHRMGNPGGARRSC